MPLITNDLSYAIIQAKRLFSQMLLNVFDKG